MQRIYFYPVLVIHYLNEIWFQNIFYFRGIWKLSRSQYLVILWHPIQIVDRFEHLVFKIFLWGFNSICLCRKKVCWRILIKVFGRDKVARVDVPAGPHLRWLVMDLEPCGRTWTCPRDRSILAGWSSERLMTCCGWLCQGHVRVDFPF